MSIDYEAAKFWLQALNLLGLVALGIYTWITNGNKEAAAGLKTLEKSTTEWLESMEEKIEPLLAQHSSRLDRIESDMKHMPNQGEISELKGDMKAVKVFQESIELQLETMRKGVNRIEDFLLRDK